MAAPAPPFCHLHVHSDYSILDGACRIARLLDRVEELGQGAVALTDHGVMSGAVELYREARKRGITPVVGLEAYVVPERGARPAKEKRNHLTLLAETTEGYYNLIRLCSAGFLEGYHRKPRIDHEAMARHADGIIALSGCLSGAVATHLEDDDLAAARSELDTLSGIFGPDDVFIEIQDAGLAVQKRVNAHLSRLARETGLREVATCDAHYPCRADADAHEALLAIQTRDLLANPKRFRFETKEFFLKSADEMAASLPEHAHALPVAGEIAARCAGLVLPLGDVKLPRFPVPDGRPPDEYLEELCRDGLARRYPGGAPAVAEERLRFELDVIGEMGFSGYFLIVWDYLRWAREHGVAVGPGRGSAAGSLVAYALRIVDLDPLAHDLLFERFLNPERKSMPDIDSDFSVAGRDAVVRYVTEKYGQGAVARIGTFGKLLARAVVRDAGRVLGHSYATVDRIAKLVPERPLGIKLADAMRPGSDLAQAYEADAVTREVIDTARPLEGLVRNEGVHAAGVVIAPGDVTDYLPVRLDDEGNVVTQVPDHDVESLGLLKMDFLGLRNLDVIQGALRMIEERGGGAVDIETIPLDDAGTYAMLARGEGVGVFQFESSGMRDALREVGPTEFADLIALVALYRPGPMAFISTYAKNKRDPSRVTYEDPRLEPILAATNGVCITGDALVADARTGQRHRLDAVRDLDDLVVQGVDEELRPATGRVTRWMDNGERPVFALRLRNGARLKLTADHPLLTEEGWRPLRELAVGGYVGTPPVLMGPAEARQPIDRRRLLVLAYLIAEGDLGSGIKFISKNPAMLAEYARCLEAFPGVHPSYRQQARGVTRVGLRRREGSRYHEANGVLAWLRELGLKEPRGEPQRGLRSHEKFVPEFVFELGPDEIAYFVASLWDGDGYIGKKLSSYKTISQRLARDVQHLLLRLGVPSTIYESTYSSVRGDRVAYQVTVYETQRLAEQLQPFMVTDKALVPCSSRSYTTLRRDLFMAELTAAGSSNAHGIGFHHFRPAELARRRISAGVATRVASSVALPRTVERMHISWQEIVAIEPAGVERVYDLEVEGIHSFTADGVSVHNCIFQEGLMQIARAIAGFTPSRADDLRKAVGKKDKVLMASLKDEFIAGCLASDTQPKVAQGLWGLCEAAGDYSFNKSHAACYALLAYRTAWLKSNHTAEYMAALLSSVMDTKDRVPFYVAACADLGLAVLPPDVNESRADFAVTGDREIRFGLTAVKGVGDNAVAAICTARDGGGRFVSLWDFCRRVDQAQVNKRALESLIRAGALDSTGASRMGMLRCVGAAVAQAARRRNDAAAGAMSLFGGAEDGVEPPEMDPAIPSAEMPRDELLAAEKESLGLYVSSHPLSGVRQQLGRATTCALAGLAERADREAVTVGGIVGATKAVTTRRGEPMMFVRLDDLEGTVEVVVTPAVFAEARELLTLDATLLVSGRVDHKGEGETKVVADSIRPFRPREGGEEEHLLLRLDAGRLDGERLGLLHRLLADHVGPAAVVLDMATAEGRRRLRLGEQFRVNPSDASLVASLKTLFGERCVA